MPIRRTVSARPWLLVGVAILALLMVQGTGAETIAVGPYVQRVTPHETVIHWMTPKSPVRFGTARDKLDRKAGAYEHHEVTLAGLKPETVYYYNVSEEGSKEGAGHFTTAPADREQPFTFVAYGDTRTRADMHRKVVEAVIREKPQFILHTGDIVSDGRNPEHWEIYFQGAGDLMRNVPLFFCLGNHERDSPMYFEQFALPGNERYYSFDWGGCHFIALDTNNPRFPGRRGYLGREEMERREEIIEAFWDEQLTWLSDDLEAHQDADFIIVFFHHPLRSTKSSRMAERETHNRRFGRIFRDFGVDIIFNGHDHNYQHHHHKGIHHIVTGGGGAPLYDIEEENADKYTVKLAQTEHYVRVRVEGRMLTAEAVGLDGKVIDAFELKAER